MMFGIEKVKDFVLVFLFQVSPIQRNPPMIVSQNFLLLSWDFSPGAVSDPKSWGQIFPDDWWSLIFTTCSRMHVIQTVFAQMYFMLNCGVFLLLQPVLQISHTPGIILKLLYFGLVVLSYWCCICLVTASLNGFSAVFLCYSSNRRHWSPVTSSCQPEFSPSVQVDNYLDYLSYIINNVNSFFSNCIFGKKKIISEFIAIISFYFFI